MIQSMLSTIDNPYDPFTQYDLWYNFDERQGYHSSAYLGRIVKQTEDLGQSVSLTAIDEAIDEIVEQNIIGLYVKVTKDLPEKQIPLT